MTDLSKQLLEKAHGGPKLSPDEQRRYLGTFEERVLGYADISTANSPELEHGFFSILESFQEKVEILFVKISPVDEKDLRLAFSSLWEEKKAEPPKKSIWKKWFG